MVPALALELAAWPLRTTMESSSPPPQGLHIEVFSDLA